MHASEDGFAYFLSPKRKRGNALPRLRFGLTSFLAGSTENLPADALRRRPDAEPIAKLIEDIDMARIAAVQVFAFRDQFQVVVALHTLLSENGLERSRILGIDNQEFVLVELNLN